MIRYPAADDSEIANFIRIYLKLVSSDELHDLGGDFISEVLIRIIRINKTSYFGNYLMDINYEQFSEDSSVGLHFP